MQTELDALEEKLQQLIATCSALRNDNHLLRQQLLAADRKQRQLHAQISEATERLDALLARLPGEAN
jgi:hypothetical protein